MHDLTLLHLFPVALTLYFYFECIQDQIIHSHPVIINQIDEGILLVQILCLFSSLPNFCSIVECSRSFQISQIVQMYKNKWISNYLYFILLGEEFGNYLILKTYIEIISSIFIWQIWKHKKPLSPFGKCELRRSEELLSYLPL